MSTSEDRSRTRPLRVHLSLIITAFLVLVSASLVGFNYVQGRRGGIADATHAMQIFADRIAERYRILAADAVSFIGLASVEGVFASPPPHRLDEKVRLLSRAAAQSRYVDGVYVGYAGGEFIHVVDLSRSRAWRETLKPPADANFAVRVIAAGGEKERLSRWEYVSADGQPRGNQPAQPTDYDPRRRPWYQAGLSRSIIVTTRPYRMATTGETGMTIARSHREDARTLLAPTSCSTRSTTSSPMSASRRARRFLFSTVKASSWQRPASAAMSPARRFSPRPGASWWNA